MEDLFDYLEKKRIRIPSSSKYLGKLTKTVASKLKHPLWGSTNKVEAAPIGRIPRAFVALQTRSQRRVLDECLLAGEDVVVLD